MAVPSTSFWKWTFLQLVGGMVWWGRGSLLLPDIESCYSGARVRYVTRERAALLDQLEHRPEAQWRPPLQFSFRNEGKLYGSPMFDAVWRELQGLPGPDPMAQALHHLRSATLSCPPSANSHPSPGTVLGKRRGGVM